MTEIMTKFELTPVGPFNLNVMNQYFGGWLSFSPDQSSIAMIFPIEEWRASTVVILHQDEMGNIIGEVYGAGKDTQIAWRQALAVLSLDNDATGWVEVGQRDPVIGNLQNSYQFIRPVLFHSPYEAAAAFVIGHRISIQQGRNIRMAMAQEIGEKLQVGETRWHAFPRPQSLLELSNFKGVNDVKIQRLRGVAQAALDGLLDRTYLRSISVGQALEKLRALDGIGEFFAQGILLRGAGLVDEVTDDDVTKEAVQLAYKLHQSPNQKTVLNIAEIWRPYRMWATVLLHIWLRREAGGPHRQQISSTHKQR